MVAHPGPPQIRARAINAHGSSFQPSRPAIRRCFVDTSTGSDAPAMFPSNGQLKRRPLHSAGSCGRVPPPQRYYGTLRLPAAHLAALRCLRLAIPSFRPLFVPASSGRELRIHLELVAGTPTGSHDGNDRVSQVPERPSCPCALFLDPGRTEVRQAIAAPRHGPRLCQQRWLPRAEDFGARSHGIGTRCLRFAMEVARHHARLASGCWPSFAGRDSLTRRVAMKGFRVQSLPPFSSLPDAMTPFTSERQASGRADQSP